MNLAYGLLGSAGVDPPAAWPAMEPVGTATSWTCQVPESAGPSGVHVEDGVAVRCMGATCTTTDFGIPDDETYVPTEVPAPGWAAAYTQLPTWFERACAGEAE